MEGWQWRTFFAAATAATNSEFSRFAFVVFVAFLAISSQIGAKLAKDSKRTFLKLKKNTSSFVVFVYLLKTVRSHRRYD